jgi:hypothetical protein
VATIGRSRRYALGLCAAHPASFRRGRMRGASATFRRFVVTRSV